MSSLPNWLLIGAPRAGTTWLARNLRAHPQVFLPDREVHFFDRHLGSGLDWYRRQFNPTLAQTSVGDATPSYLHCDRRTPELLSQWVPEARLVAILRDPIDRARSEYYNSLSKRRAVASTFEAEFRSNEWMRRAGRYAASLRNYWQYFARDRMLILRYEDLAGNPGALFEAVVRFLEIDPCFKPPLLDFRVNSVAPKLRMYHSRILYLAQQAATKLGRHRVAGAIQSLNNKPLPGIAEETRKRLFEEHYAADVAALESELGWDLSGWRCPGQVTGER